MSSLVLTEADFANLSLLDSPKLKHRLAGATRVPSDAMSPAVITMNSVVSYRDPATGEHAQVQVVYPQDARSRSRDRVSVLSSMGLALLGASRGETVEWGAGASHRRLYIEEVLHQPESSMQKHLFVRD